MVSGLFTIIQKGQRNIIYNLPGDCELPNIEVVKKIIAFYFDKKYVEDCRKYIKLNYVRIGEDRRYSLNGEKVRSLGWKPKRNFDEELKKQVNCYKNNFIW